MKHIKLFEEYSTADVNTDSETYSEFLKLTKSDIENIRRVYKRLKWDALQNLNKKLNAEGHQGQILNIDAGDYELVDHLSPEKANIFKKYSRFLDFDLGFKPKKSKEPSEVLEYHSDPNTIAYYRYEEEVVDELEDKLLDKIINKHAIIIKSAFELGKDAKQCVKDIIQKINIDGEN